MHRLRPRTSVLSGAAIGIFAGAAVFGAVSSAASRPTPTAFQPVSAVRAITPPGEAPCAAHQTLLHGVCVVHVVRTVTVPAAGSPSYPGLPSYPGGAVTTSGTRAAAPAHHETEPAGDAAEHAANQRD